MNIKKCLLYKSYLKNCIKSFLLPLFMFIIINNYNLEDFIEKELCKIKSNPQTLNWTNVEKDFTILALKYKYLIKNEKKIPENSPIWTMWYQGIKNAPPIVISCIKSIILNRGKHRVFIIDKYNIDNFIQLPSYIKEKLNNRTFSITHLSDIIRMGLLYKYGGYWIDSTIFITTPIISDNKTFFTLKKPSCFKHPFINCKWCGYFFGTTKKSFISTYSYIAFLFYWKKYNSLISYFLIDYIIHIAYQKVEPFKNLIENLPFYKCNIPLVKELNFEYNKTNFKCSFYKLTYKKNFMIFNGTKQTNFGFLIENYKLNFKSINKNIIF